MRLPLRVGAQKWDWREEMEEEGSIIIFKLNYFKNKLL